MCVRGSLLTYLCEGGAFGAWQAGRGRGRYPDVLQERLRVAFRRFGEWKKQKGLVSTQARFTCARLNRKLRSDFPCLSSKGIASKRLSFWLADVAVEWANREEATELDKLVASCAYSYVSFLQMIDEYPLVLTRRQAQNIFKAGPTHLQTYSRLRSLSSEVVGAHANNRCLWQLAPKHHYMMHELDTVKRTRINCRHFTLLTGEGFMGVISRMARPCHRSNVSKRVLQRYKVKLALSLRRHFARRD